LTPDLFANQVLTEDGDIYPDEGNAPNTEALPEWGPASHHSYVLISKKNNKNESRINTSLILKGF
jgi:hypothetical protein